jgi:hypothetical protein
MLPSANEVRAALVGSVRLARLDASGLQLFDRTLGGFWRSFFAAILIAPTQLFLLAVTREIPDDVSVVRAVVVEASSYAMAWLAFPVVMLLVVDLLKRRERFFDYMVAYNWTNVPQAILLLIVTLLIAGGVLPGRLGDVLWYVALGSILTYQWFVAKVGLRISGLVAVALVLLDLVLALSIGAITRQLLRIS